MKPNHQHSIKTRAFDPMVALGRRFGMLPARVIGFAENAALRALRTEPRYPPLFIVGAPRSGTTLPYLYLLDRFHFSYFPNRAKRHPAMPVAVALTASRHRKEGFGQDSHYGTVDGGLGPSDGWDIFHRWFPRYGVEPVRHDRLGELRRIVGAYERLYGAPFINKNNHNSIRIQDLDGIFPDALFIHVTRNVVDASLSLLEARRRHGVPLGRWWSCPPPQYLGREFTTEVEQVVHTIVGIQQHVRGQLARLSGDRWMEVSYDAFCATPDVLADWVEQRYPAGILQQRPGAETAVFEAHAGRPNPDLVAEINAVLETL